MRRDAGVHLKVVRDLPLFLEYTRRQRRLRGANR